MMDDGPLRERLRAKSLMAKGWGSPWGAATLKGTIAVAISEATNRKPI